MTAGCLWCWRCPLSGLCNRMSGHLGPPSSTWEGSRDDPGFCFLCLSSVWHFPKCLLEIGQSYHLPAIVCLGQRHNLSEPQVLYPKSRPKILGSWLYEWGTLSNVEWKSMKRGKTAPSTWQELPKFWPPSADQPCGFSTEGGLQRKATSELALIRRNS